MKDTLRLLFGFDEPVTRRLYIIAGLSLFALKYAVDCGFMYLGTGNVLNPIEYMHPSLTMRWEALMGKAPAELGFWWFFLSAIWALPFIWIGVSMSARRARNAGVSPWIALLFFVPLVNLLVMLGLSVAKTAEAMPIVRLLKRLRRKGACFATHYSRSSSRRCSGWVSPV